MSGGVPRQRHRRDRGQHLAGIDDAEPVAIAVEHLTRDLEIAARPLAGAAEMAIVLPECDLAMVDDQLGIREGGFSRRRDQPADMIGMRVGQKDGVDLRGVNARLAQVGPEMAAPLPDAARAGVDQHSAPAGAHEITIDMHGGRIRDPRLVLHPAHIGRIDVRERIEADGKIAIADGGNRDITDPPGGEQGGRHHHSPNGRSVARVQARRRVAETADACGEAGCMPDGVIELLHEPLHELWRARRGEPIANVREHRMAATMADRNVDDVHVFQCSLEHAGAKVAAPPGQLRQRRSLRQASGRNEDRDIGHCDSTVPVCGRCRRRQSIAR